jgi:hypothetical protein
LVLTAGYAFAFTQTATGTNSAYDPGANAACEATGGHLDAPACGKRRHGLAAPTAAGSYQSVTHAFGSTLTLQL